MHIDFTHRFAAPPRDVVAMYADEDFARTRASATGATDSDVLIDGGADEAFTVAIRRVTPTEGIRADMKGLVGPTIVVNYTESWSEPEGDSRDATFAVEIVGVPARAAGTIALAPDGDGSVLTAEGSVSSSAFLVASAVSKAVAEALASAIEQEFAAADAWLAR
jgi:hypothetical protein